MDVQILLFEIVRSKIEKDFSVVETVSDVLNINIDAAYRRLRGKTRLTIDEVAKLCTHFDISLNHALQLKVSDDTVFDYQSADLTNIEEYYPFIEKMATVFVNLARSGKKDIITLTHNIPLYRLMDYPELSFFYLYVWNQNVNPDNMTYDQFVNSIDKEKILFCHARVATSVKQIPLTEIWTQDTFSSMTDLIVYYYDLGRFENKDVPLSLCHQLLSFIDDVERWTGSNGADYEGQTIPYSLYESSLRMVPNLSVAKTNNSIWGLIHLFRIQSLFTTSERFCQEMDIFLKNIMVDSLYVNGASLQERHQIFHKKRISMEDLIRKIQATDGSNNR